MSRDHRCWRRGWSRCAPVALVGDGLIEGVHGGEAFGRRAASCLRVCLRDGGRLTAGWCEARSGAVVTAMAGQSSPTHVLVRLW